jgi:hypothetical protein
MYQPRTVIYRSISEILLVNALYLNNKLLPIQSGTGKIKNHFSTYRNWARMFIFVININKIRDYFPPLKKLVQKVNQQFFGWLAGKKKFEAKICQRIYKGSDFGL